MAWKFVATAVVIIVSAFAVRKYQERKWGRCKSKRLMKNKTVIVTGANSGLGKATALELANTGARVILACRDQGKAQKALMEIRSQSRNGSLRVLPLDLSSFESIKSFADEFLGSEERLDVLINNAGVFQCPFSLTKDGFEMQFGVNHLGHFLLTKLLLERLKQSTPSRVIMVSSSLYEKGNIDFDNLNSEKNYERSLAYSNSKLANILFSRELAKHINGCGVSVYAVSPGMVWTNLGRHVPLNWLKMILLIPFAWFFIRTPYQGCQTTLHCALSEDAEKETGFYYRNCKMEPFADVAKDDTVSKKLWEVSELLIKEKLTL